MPLVLFVLLIGTIFLIPLIFMPTDIAVITGICASYVAMLVIFKARTIFRLFEVSAVFLCASALLIVLVQNKLHSKNIVFTAAYSLFEWTMALLFSSIVLFILVSIPMVVIALFAGKRT